MARPPMLTLQDIADLAHVSRPVVSTWRRRARARGRVLPFPQPVMEVRGVEHFDRDKVVTWLEDTGRGNNAEARQDAPGLSVPEDADLEDVVTLLCLRALTGEEVADLSETQLVGLAERADADDRLFLREVRALGQTPALLRYIDDLIEASYGGSDALARVESGRLRREAAERGLTDDLVALVGAVTAAGRAHLGDDEVALVSRSDHQLARRLVGGFAGLVLTGDDPPARAQRRRVVLDGVDLLDEARTSVQVLSVVGKPDTDALEAMDDLVVSLGQADVGVVLGTARLLCDPVVGDAERLRSRTLRPRSVVLAVRLPRGLWKEAHRQSLALWILRGGRRARWLRMADLGAGTIAMDDFASDVAAALGDTEDRAYRYARRAEWAPVLVGGPVVPRGVRAVRLGKTGATTHLDRVHTAALITREPIPGFDVTVAAAPGQVLLRQRSLGELATAGHVVLKRGSRINMGHAQPDGTVRALSADGSTDHFRMDPFDAVRLYSRAARTERGDVVFIQVPRPMARVDAEGGALVVSPSRILRLQPGAAIGPWALAALVNDLACPGTEWQAWNVPELPSPAAYALEAVLAAAADHRAALRRHEQAVKDLTTSLIEGVAAGAVTIEHTITKKAG